MEDFNKSKFILKLIRSNKNGVDMNSILEYLDYVNKVRYTEEEIEVELMNLVRENKISHVNGLWVNT